MALAGCTADGTSTSGTATPTATSTASSIPVDLSSPLHPVYPSPFTAAANEKETVRVAGAIQALIPLANILYVDDHSQVVTATETAGQYYGVLRTITLVATNDPIAQARLIVTKLQGAGWIERQTSDTDGNFFVAMSSDEDSAKSWFVIVGGDTSVAKQSVVTLQVASPTLPG